MNAPLHGGTGDWARWLSSGLVALAAHASVATAILAWPVTIPDPQAPVAVMVDLAPVAQPAPKQPQRQASPPEPEREKTPPEKVEELAEAPEVPLPKPRPKPRRVHRPKVQQAEPSPVAPESPPAAPVVAQAPAQVSAPPVFARPSPEQRDRYFAELKAWLERHKRYPLDARRAHIQGTTTLYFVIDRAGRVIDFRIDRSSGFSVLDREVTAMVERAGRLPPMPDSLPGGTIALSLPVQFRLR